MGEMKRQKLSELKEKLIMYGEAPEQGNRQSHVAEQIAWQQKIIAEIHEVFDDIHKRLEKVLRKDANISSDSKAKMEEAPPPLVPLAEDIRTNNQRLESVLRTMRDIARLMEL